MVSRNTANETLTYVWSSCPNHPNYSHSTKAFLTKKIIMVCVGLDLTKGHK